MVRYIPASQSIQAFASLFSKVNADEIRVTFNGHTYTLATEYDDMVGIVAGRLVAKSNTGEAVFCPLAEIQRVTVRERGELFTLEKKADGYKARRQTSLEVYQQLLLG